MPTFTDTELQKKFCEGFTFFPFKSLEQHDTLIYKCYTGKDDLKKLLEWHNKEHDSSHYIIKIANKLRNTDIPAATRLMEVLRQAPGKDLSGATGKYHSLLTSFHNDTLQPLAAKLSDKFHSSGIENIEQMQDAVRRFMQSAEVLQTSLNGRAGKKHGLLSDREFLSKAANAMELFRALQKRNLTLLDAWKNRQMIHNSYRAMN
ncbi:hypothetical protein [Chitinophaga sp. YIM B06452]|uniref:hypothetical protein n=1 Tax=Chitinophaga sp. YIM B06452 TaxID=3082158 RepID=UPI0031FE9381